MPYFNRWGNFRLVQPQPVPRECLKDPACPIPCRFPFTLELKNSLINLLTHLCYLYFSLCIMKSVALVRKLQGISNAETDFQGAGEGESWQRLCFKKCDTPSCTRKHAHSILWLMITLYISPATYVAGVNKIQVRYSQSADSTNKGLCKQDT